ncbi:MAG: hypothetical protein IJ914_04285 [Prevotella sp.]|nr:hypothetical protein [Prevotella sp.]
MNYELCIEHHSGDKGNDIFRHSQRNEDFFTIYAGSINLPYQNRTLLKSKRPASQPAKITIQKHYELYLINKNTSCPFRVQSYDVSVILAIPKNGYFFIR